MAQKNNCDCTSIHPEAVAEVEQTMLPETELSAISSLFKVLGDPTRARIVLALDQREVCVNDLAVALDMKKSAISHQLALLKAHKIVKSRREGKNMYYSLDDQHVTDIIELVQVHIAHTHV